MTLRVTAALRAVQVVAERPDPTEPMTVGGIARELGATLSAASRLCSDLEGLGYLERGDAYGTYRAGRGALRLSGRAAAPFATTVRYALTLAAQQTGETVLVAARSASGMRVVASVESLWTLQSPADVGEVVTNEQSAVARAATEMFAGGGEPGPRLFESTTGMSVEVAAPVLGPAGDLVSVLAVRLPVNRSEQNLARARRALTTAKRSIENALDDRLSAPRAAAASAGAVPVPSALEGAFRILHHLAARPDSVAGTSRAVGLRPDRTRRLIDSCVRAGWVRPSRDGGQFQLGWSLHGWYRAAAVPTMIERGKPLVAEVANRTRTCAFITVLKGMRSYTIVEELEMAGEGLQMSPWLGRPHPMIGSDGGPTLVMDLAPADITMLFPSRHTSHELDVFLERVRRVARDGVLSMQAFDDAGIVSISAPVRDSSATVVAAVCIVGTTEYVRENARAFDDAARALAHGISSLLD